jgi:CrcB protein
MLLKLTWVALAGAIGTLARYGITGLAPRWFGPGFPWGTMIVNALGCLFAGFFWVLGEERLLIARETRLMIMSGFLGAFTTFSTFAFETAQQLRYAQWRTALANVFLQIVLGLALVFLGFALGRRVG